MTYFEPFLKSDSRFRANTMPELGLRKEENDRNFFISQLSLTAGEKYEVLLKDTLPPQPLKIPPLGRIDSHSLEQSLGSILVVLSNNPRVADVRFKQNHGLGTVYEIITDKLTGVALIQANRFQSAVPLAQMRVTVVPKPAERAPDEPRIDVDVLASLKEFYVGFREGLALSTKDTVRMLEAKMRAASVATGGLSDAAMNAAFCKGFAQGLEESATGFLDMLKGVGKFVFDARFREEIERRAAELIQPWIEGFILAKGDLAKLLGPILANARAIGRVLGDEVGKEANEKIASMSLTDLAEFSGRIFGIVAFEIIVAIITELVGIGVVQGLRWLGEGSGLVARLFPRLRQIVEGSGQVKVFLRAKFSRFLKTAEELEEAGSMAGPKGRSISKAAKKAFWDAGRVAPKSYTAEQERLMADKIAGMMKKVGVDPANIGIKNFPDENGLAFNAKLGGRGGNVRGRGIAVYGDVELDWAGFPEWNAQKNIDARIEAIIAHEHMEFNDLSHWETVELVPETRLRISSEARDLLAAMQKRGRGWQTLK